MMRSLGRPSASANCAQRIYRFRILVHEAREQIGVEAAPVDADTDRLAVVDRPLDHHRELRVVLAALADVARVDPILRQRHRAIREIAEQLVAVEMEVANQWHMAIECVEPLADRRHRCRSICRVDRDSYQLRAGVGQRFDLGDRGRDIGSIGVGHRLHDDRRAAPDRDPADECNFRPTTADQRSTQGAHFQISHAYSLKCAPLPARLPGIGCGALLKPFGAYEFAH